MRFVVITERGTFARNARPGQHVYAGVCPLCDRALLVVAPRDDGDVDAVCVACARVAGHVVVNARVDGHGDVVDA